VREKDKNLEEQKIQQYHLGIIGVRLEYVNLM
jgi:hypothetical protein